MTIDPVSIAGLVTREVRTGSRDGAATKIVVARRSYATTLDDLWDAVTNAERIPRWFLPVTGELRLGGHYQLEGNAGGIVERCEAPEHFAVTWDIMGHRSWVEVHLSPALEGATLELHHEALIDLEFWPQFGPGAAGVGWDLGLIGLGLHLDGGAAPMDPREADDWATTPDGIVFVHESAKGWAEAAIADGDDPVSAQEAAERTITFYTVEPEASDSE